MDSERRYDEDEVAEILDRATETSEGGSGSGGAGGLTLRELHEIGREVGISEDAITRAAHGLERPAVEPTSPQTFLGQTIGVGRTVYLPRRLTDQEWQRLVVELRETFDAKGKIHEQGVFRQWTNNNLQALLEPTESGERLRLRTVKGSARPFQSLGGVFVGLGTLMGVLDLTNLRAAVVYMVVGAGFFLSSRLTVPGWARSRARQFEEIIARLSSMVGALPSGLEPTAGMLDSGSEPEARPSTEGGTEG